MRRRSGTEGAFSPLLQCEWFTTLLGTETIPPPPFPLPKKQNKGCIFTRSHWTSADTTWGVGEVEAAHLKCRMMHSTKDKVHSLLTYFSHLRECYHRWPRTRTRRWRCGVEEQAGAFNEANYENYKNTQPAKQPPGPMNSAPDRGLLCQTSQPGDQLTHLPTDRPTDRLIDQSIIE